MKLLNTLLSNTIICLLAIMSFSCGTSTSDDTKLVATEIINLQEANPIIKSYLILKDNLVETNGKKARNSAQNFLKVTKSASGDGVELMRKAAENIANSDDVEIQRENFETVSDNLYIYAQDNDMGILLYRQHCPMAFKNNGASWLSAESKIMNPYFGDKMLHCGTVEDEF